MLSLPLDLLCFSCTRRLSNGLLHQFQHVPVAFAEAFGGVHDQQDEVGTFQSIMDFAHHLAVEAAIGLVDSGSINEDDLSGGASFGGLDVGDALDARPRGLGLFGDDGDFFAYQSVQQRGFAGVRASDDGNEARTKSHQLNTNRERGETEDNEEMRDSSDRVIGSSGHRKGAERFVIFEL